jgi:S-DNA-T family DNA segregation ATPase FtsK/SpoIIIE
LPSLDFLEATEQTANDVEEIRDSAESLDKALRQFQIKGKVEETLVAPMVLTHFVKTQGGTKISEIERLLSDVSRYMGLPEDVVRLNLDVEGKEGKIAVEVPLKSRRNIGLLELMQSAPGEMDSIQLPLRLGVSTLGRTICTDLTEMPHLLVAGSTGSGKSIALNSMLVSLLFHCSPEKLRLVLIDPKMVEFSHFRGLPHLHGDVITESSDAIDALNGLTDIMDHRYRLLNESGFRNLAEYNEAENNGEDMPHIVVVIDELADLLMVEGKIAEEPIVRLAQKARAAGIHLIMATQRPTADVITGLIKTNVPARLAFRVSSNVDSRVILNQKGAESLQGKGDALFLNPAGKGLIRLQSPMVGLEEIERVTGFWKSFC